MRRQRANGMLAPAEGEDHMNDTDKIAAAILASAYAIKSTGTGVEFFVDAYERFLQEMAERGVADDAVDEGTRLVVHRGHES